jgi:putative transposase
MPNHVHGIITLNVNAPVETRHALSQNRPNDEDVETRHALSNEETETRHALSNEETETRHALSNEEIETRHALSLRDAHQKTPGQQRFQNQGKNTLSSIVGGYKAAVTKHANRLKFNFAWQPRFHDHIIRDEQSFQTISNYIINNPCNWQQDKFFK